MTKRSSVLELAIRKQLAGRLIDQGYQYDGKKTFRRIDPSRGTIRIVEFQVGARSLAGRFTVNLGVYAPQFALGPEPAASVEVATPTYCLPGFSERLGCVIEGAWMRFFSKLFGPPDGWWKHILYGPRDRWWRYSENAETTTRQVAITAQLILGPGMQWLDRKDDPVTMERTHQEVQARQRANRLARKTHDLR